MKTETEKLTTTNVRLPKRHLRALKQEALRRDKSVGFIVRELIRAHVHGDVPKGKQSRKIISIWDLPKLAADMGDNTLASCVDEIVYGAKKHG